MREDTADSMDWSKVPSEITLQPGVTDAKQWLEEQGMTDTYLYRRLVKDPEFEERYNAYLLTLVPD